MPVHEALKVQLMLNKAHLDQMVLLAITDWMDSLAHEVQQASQEYLEFQVCLEKKEPKVEKA